MLRPDRSIERVYLHRAPVDMRKQIDGLAALVEGVLKENRSREHCSSSLTVAATS